LTRVLVNRVADLAIVRVQSSVRLDKFSAPQPDIALLRPDPDFYRQQAPTAADVLLVIEVSDTTIAADRKIKVPLYARYGVPEVWLVNLNKQCLEVYLQPAAHGYANKRVARRGETVTSSQLPQLCVAVAEVLG
jgi:Uma2 family endonuclease